MASPKKNRTCAVVLDKVSGFELSDKLHDMQDSCSDATNSGDSDPDFVAQSSSSSSSSTAPSTDDEADKEDPKSGWTAKNGMVWLPTNEETVPFIQPARGLTPGPTRYGMVRVQTVESAFDLFFTNEMIDHIVRMTNLNGRCGIKDWIELDSTDLRAYIGLLILAGIYRSKGESTPSLWDDRSGRAIFRATMSLAKFYRISRALCFCNKLQGPDRPRGDKLAPIRTLWEMWTHRLPLLFNPGKDVTVDEQLVPFKGRCSFRQYMPKKNVKYGIKIWVTADVKTSYAWKCDVYLGKTDDTPEVGQGKRVVLEMTKGLQGVTVTCDNFFTSYSLAQELLKQKIALIGAIRQSKPEWPRNLVNVKGRAVFSSIFAFTKNTTAVSYIQRRGKNVTLISTQHRTAVVTEGDKKKPEIITEYNRCKGGVNNLDKVVRTYSCRRKSTYWPRTLFFHMLDVTAYNAFVIYTAVNPTWNRVKLFKRRLFLEELGNSLISAEILQRSHFPHAPVAAALVKKIQSSAAASSGTDPETESENTSIAGGKRGTCKGCKTKKKRTIMTCISCGGHVCKDHHVICCRSCLNRASTKTT